MPVRGMVAPIGAMGVPRAAHTATRLRDGRVLIVGGCTLASCELSADGATAELFDPATTSFARTGAMATERVSHTATLLPDGSVLIVGGWRKGGVTDSVERYDPASGTFATVGGLSTPRGGHAAAALTDGRVLIVGGSGAGGMLASAEVFDPHTNTVARVGDLGSPRGGPSAVALDDGRVLVIGGDAARDRALASAELFDPASGSFAPTGAMTVVRRKHAAIRLPDGRVLVVGGSDERDSRGRYASAEVYDPATGRFRPVGALATPRFKLGETLVLLPGGGVLVAGGAARPEVFDPTNERFASVGGDLGAAWAFATATALPDGRVLIAGGYDERIAVTARAWVYAPGP